jgi:hypothetical protein
MLGGSGTQSKYDFVPTNTNKEYSILERYAQFIGIISPFF